MIFNVTSGGGAASVGSWRFATATAKPASVANNTMLAICATAPSKITVADTAPATPAANDVWFHVANPEGGRAMSDGSVPVKCWGAYQYLSSVWTLATAYYSYLGIWWELPGLPASGTALADCTWEQISRIGAAGKAADYFCVGDEKTIVLSTSESIALQIIGFDHDDLSAAGGGKAPITFGFKNCMNARQQLNATETNTGGYSGCAMYSTIGGSICNSLPADVRAAMKDVNKLTSSGNASNAVVTTQNTLFMLSEIEIFGANTYAFPGEGTRYAFFTNGGSKVKTADGVASGWWTRSPYSANSAAFCCVTPSGTSYTSGASSSLGIVLAFCV